MTDVIDYFDSSISRDLFYMSVGELVGKGSTRHTYRYGIDTTKVIKFEIGAKKFQNVLEWEIWDLIKWTKHAKWFAPCVNISPCGTVLLQEHVRDAESSELPTEVPVFFSDLKKENYGMLNGQFVCRDYGLTLLNEKGLSNKMKKVEW